MHVASLTCSWRNASAWASDLHLAVGLPPYFRVQGLLERQVTRPALTATDTQGIADVLAKGLDRQPLETTGSLDGAMTGMDGTRYRFNIFRRQGTLSISIRRLEDRFRSLAELGLSESLYRLCDLPDGLVVVAGPTGAGKSTTLATLLDRINRTRPCHMVTIEDPIEYVHAPIKALVNQRQIGGDASSFHEALVASLRQDPNVVLVGEIRDLNTIRTAIVAAETGHLVFTTVHAGDCVGAIERLVSVFPADEQDGIRRQLSLVLRAILTQHLVVADGHLYPQETPYFANGGDSKAVHRRRSRIVTSEVLTVTPAVSNLIATAKSNQVVSAMGPGRRPACRPSNRTWLGYGSQGTYRKHRRWRWPAIRACFAIGRSAAAPGRPCYLPRKDGHDREAASRGPATIRGGSSSMRIARHGQHPHRPGVGLAVPASLALRRQVLPFASVGGEVYVACRDPHDRSTLEAVERSLHAHSRLRSRACFAPPRARPCLRRQAGASAAQPGPRPRVDAAAEPDSEGAVAICDELLHAAIVRQASDIHLDPNENETLVRLRVDGVLEKLRTLPAAIHGGVISRLKVQSGLDIAEKRAPQDGRFTHTFGPSSQKIDIRVATLPTQFGERMTLRLLAVQTESLTLERLGMCPSDLNAFSHAIAKPHGLILLTGPTGSGKSTTLYAALRRIIAESDAEREHDRGPHRVQHRRRGPGRGRFSRQGELQQGPAERAASRPGRGHDRRNSRQGNRRRGDQGLVDRTLGLQFLAHQLAPRQRSRDCWTWASTAFCRGDDPPGRCAASGAAAMLALPAAAVAD